MQRIVITRTSTQSRSHAQKFLAKIKRKGVTLAQFLAKIDIKKLNELSACEIGYDEDLDLMVPNSSHGSQANGISDTERIDNTAGGFNEADDIFMQIE